MTEFEREERKFQRICRFRDAVAVAVVVFCTCLLVLTIMQQVGGMP